MNSRQLYKNVFGDPPYVTAPSPGPGSAGWDGASPPPTTVSGTPAVTQSDIESALTARGYRVGTYTTTYLPKYSKAQVIQMAVDEILNRMGLPVRSSTMRYIPPDQWKRAVSEAFSRAITLAKMTVAKSAMTGPTPVTPSSSGPGRMDV